MLNINNTNYNFIKLGFILLIIPIVLFGFLINVVEKYLPVFVRRAFRFGKFAYRTDKNDLISLFEVPKAWFKHFYVFSTAYSTLVLLVMVNVYLFGNSVPLGFVQLLDLCVGVSRKASVTAFSSLLALILLTLQCYRRLYETHNVSVFSAHSKMNIFHYIVGFAHYLGAIGAIIAEAPQFAQSGNDFKSFVSFDDMTFLDIFGTILFLWAWIHQYISALILANLRKDYRGVVVSHEHKLPTGDLFEFVSSPHLLTEIVMYFALTLILLGNTTFYYVFAWVLANQFQVCLLNHQWYKQTFKDYPKTRKAIIPFIL